LLLLETSRRLRLAELEQLRASFLSIVPVGARRAA
jgi:hypothetical protein